jgi:hypothetical protein
VPKNLPGGMSKEVSQKERVGNLVHRGMVPQCLSQQVSPR